MKEVVIILVYSEQLKKNVHALIFIGENRQECERNTKIYIIENLVNFLDRLLTTP